MKQVELNRVMDMIRAEGNVEARLVLLRNLENTLSVINGKVDKQQRSESQSLAITLYIDGREGFFYTNVFDEQVLRDFIRQSVETTRLLAPDEARGLIDPERYYKGGGADLKNFDASLDGDVEAVDAVARELAFACNDEAYGADQRVINVDTRYTDRLHQASFLTSNGFEASEQSTRCTLSSIVSVRGEGDARPMDGWGQTRLFQRDIPTKGIGTVALERTLRKIGQRPCKAGRYTMVVESPVAASLLSPMIQAMGGQALQQHTSFLEGKLGESVGSPLLDIVDDPHIPGTRGATYFDYDGAATQRRQVFDKGRLCTYFIDTPMGRKLGMEPTTQSTHHVILTPSQSSLKELLCEQGECILVTDFNGGNCNPATGHFSYGVEGFLCRDGIIVQPISGMNITGNMLELWNNLVQVANDADPYETELVPSLAFRDVSFY